MEQRYYWGDVLQEMRAALIRSENDVQKKLSAQRPGVAAGIWIETLTTAPNLGGAAGLQSSQDVYPPQNGMNPYMRGYPQPTQPTPTPPPPDQPPPGAAAVDAGAGGSTNNIITLVCRAVNLQNVDPSANSEIAFEVEREMKSATNYFDPKTTSLTTPIVTDEATGTFTFGLSVGLVNPLQL